MEKLCRLTNLQLQEFFNSFDYVLCDVDGVLWNPFETIPGAQEALKSLKKIGKKVILVSNNTTKMLDVYHTQLTRNGFEIDKDEIVTPNQALVSYLRKQNFNKDIFLIGMATIRKELEDAGFKIAPNAPDRVDVKTVLGHAVVDDDTVGAVVVDSDINLSYISLQKAATFLRRPEVLFILGATDYHLPIAQDRILIGPGYFSSILEDITKRKGVPMAKPGLHLNEYIVEKFKITDPSRVLFIGDSIQTDLGFATECNYRKLLVLSGLTKAENLGKWEFPEEYKPDYVADSLKTVHECLMRSFGEKL